MPGKAVASRARPASANREEQLPAVPRKRGRPKKVAISDEAIEVLEIEQTPIRRSVRKKRPTTRQEAAAFNEEPSLHDIVDNLELSLSPEKDGRGHDDSSTFRLPSEEPSADGTGIFGEFTTSTPLVKHTSKKEEKERAPFTVYIDDQNGLVRMDVLYWQDLASLQMRAAEVLECRLAYIKLGWTASWMKSGTRPLDLDSDANFNDLVNRLEEHLKAQKKKRDGSTSYQIILRNMNDTQKVPANPAK